MSTGIPGRDLLGSEPQSQSQVHDNMTSMLRKKEAERRREMKMIGGGECEQVVEEMPFVEQQVIAMLAVESIDGVAGGVDIGIECEQ